MVRIDTLAQVGTQPRTLGRLVSSRTRTRSCPGLRRPPPVPVPRTVASRLISHVLMSTSCSVRAVREAAASSRPLVHTAMPASCSAWRRRGTGRREHRKCQRCRDAGPCWSCPHRTQGSNTHAHYA